MNENEQLRRRIRELEKQLIQARPRSVLELELRRRGLEQDRIEDALMLLGAEHEPATPESLTTEAVWRTKDNPKLRTLGEVVDGFQESRAYLFPSTERPAATHAPTFADGRLVPPSEMTDAELAIAAGPAPEAATPQGPAYTEREFANMSVMDRLAIAAGAEPKVEQSDSGIAELNAELEARAEHREETHQQQIKSRALPMFETKELKWGKS
jgi:hypothetical protein